MGIFRSMDITRTFLLAKEVGPDAALLVEWIQHNKHKVRVYGLNSKVAGEFIGVSPSTVNRIIKKLVERGYIEVKARSKYALTPKFYQENTKYENCEY